MNTTVRYNKKFDDMFRFDSTFAEIFGGGALKRDHSWLPRDGGGYELTLAVPGYGKEDLDITLDKNVISIVGSINASVGDGVISNEIHKTYLLRDIHLYDLEKIEASVTHGVLTIFIPPKNPNNSSGGSIKIPIT